MKITITFRNDNTTTDYLLNEDISIKTALEIISKNDQFDIPADIQYVYSIRMQEKVSINLSFKQANLFAGDIIRVMKSGGVHV